MNKEEIVLKLIELLLKSDNKLELVSESISAIETIDIAKDMIGKYCIVRSSKAGVFAGTILSRFRNEVLIKDARRIWYWSGAASLSQLANSGTSKPDDCKFPASVNEELVLDVVEILPTTDKARLSIQSVSEWKS